MPEPTETSLPATDHVNDAFHDAYEAARDPGGGRSPVLVVLADTLTLLVGTRRQAERFSPELFHVVKAVVHGPVAAFAAASDPERLKRLREHLHGCEEELSAVEGEPEAVKRLRTIVADTVRFVEGALERTPSRSQRDAFAGRLGKLLLTSTDDATRIQLAAIDRVAAKLLGTLSEAERASVQVVVAGAHQARARSLGMQFFGKLLGERAEDQLVYAESIETEDEALTLVDTRLYDRTIATAFFGEATRLERDVLGDSVKARLADYESEAERVMSRTAR